MKTREQIMAERDSILGIMQTESHGNDSCNEVNAKAWAMIDALDWVLQKRYAGKPSREIYNRAKMWQKARAAQPENRGGV